jgi:hypothetical protein
VPGKPANQVYVVVLHAESSARFANGEEHRLTDLPTPHGPAVLIFRTDFVDEGLEEPVPRSLWLEIAGPAPTIDAAVNDLGRVAANFGPMIALAANAHVDDFKPYLAFDATPGLSEREFLQNFIRADTRIPQAMRLIPWDATWAFMEAVATSEHRQRLSRAIAQYSAALSHWRPGHETFAHAHLYMGMEAITDTAIKWETDRRGFATKAELMDDLRIKAGEDAHRKLETYVRREILFGGDADLVSQARAASDGFEHGFEDLDVVHRKASTALMRTGELLRNAILTFSGLTETYVTILRDAPYTNAMPWAVSERYIRTTLVSDGPTDGSSEALARADKQYPMLEVALKLTNFVLARDNTYYDSKVDIKITPVLADGLLADGFSVESVAPTSDVGPDADSVPDA